ncbi:MAG TPA: AAA family ATPase [Sphingobacteriaceae bacterium]
MQEYIDQIITLVKQQITSNQFLSGGLILGALTSIVYSLRSIPMTIWNRIERKIRFDVTIEQTDDLYAYLQFWLNHYYADQLRNVKASFWRVRETDGDKVAVSNGSYEKKTALVENTVCFNHYGDTFIIWRYGRLIRISSAKDKMEHASNISALFFERYNISGLWAKKAIKQILDDAVKFSLELEKKRSQPLIRTNLYEGWETDRQTRMREIDKIFIQEEQKNAIVNDIQNFITNKDFYRSRCIPYRRGYLFTGPPGTGKSSLASALANLFKRDLYVLNLKACASDNNFIRNMSYVGHNSILLIEDIDSYFDGRKTESTDRVNFSTFINHLSGVSSKEDLILIVTTNHKEKLDHALLRSGRLDMHFEIGLPTSKEVNAYLSWFYSRSISEIHEPIAYTMADVENVCVQNKYDAVAAINALQYLHQIKKTA